MAAGPTQTAAPARQVPEGYLENAQGHLVPVELVAAIDRTRDELVREIVAGAQALQLQMRAWKARALGDANAFVALAAEKYGANLGGIKGNTTLVSYDGRFKVQLAVSERLVFDERIQAAKSLVDECIHAWTKGSRVEIRALVEHAFQTDKEGRINAGRMFSLMRLTIEDAKWRAAMEAIKDSMQIAGSKLYLRLYERVGKSDSYDQIALDMAAL